MTTNVLIGWTEALSVGIPSIDQQHRKIVDLINELNTAMESGETDSALRQIFRELVAYTDQHFRYEEELFERFGYGDAAGHAREHDALRKKVTELKERVDRGDFVLGVEVMSFLRDWLTHHIQGSDMAYASDLLKAGAR
ncbi:MAG TPA: bacteriohemerythrin [Candidatus Krumholzibacteria bacterium]|nr:bacteriohemerythrin [Candidatus Krumholzibacteria bacterium]